MSPLSPESREVVKLDLSAGSVQTVLVDGAKTLAATPLRPIEPTGVLS